MRYTDPELEIIVLEQCDIVTESDPDELPPLSFNDSF